MHNSDLSPFWHIDIRPYRHIHLYILHLIDICMKYRDRNEIAAQILETANGNGVRLSKIMYDGYLAHTVTKEYLGLLIEKGLIEYVDGERTFKTTEKGMNFLRIHNSVQELSPITTKLQKREAMVSYL
jgi:predicted transcriptional regulator